MNIIVAIRTNIFYCKDKNGLFKKHHELVFLIDKPSYRYSTEGEIIRERILDEVRFSVSDNNFDQLIDQLKKIKDTEESDLQ
jgi:hypothetical protein